MRYNSFTYGFVVTTEDRRSGGPWNFALPEAYRGVLTRVRWSPEAKPIRLPVALGAADRLIMEGHHQGRQTAAWPQ